MTQVFLQHTTREGERWDLIAYQYYGDALAIDGLIISNPDVPLAEQFPAGWTLLVPVIDEAPLQTQDLPPWKR